MKSLNPVSHFRRVSVADQAAQALRHAIQQQTLTDPLPGEHQLARHLGISRSSLRDALAQLESAGLISRRNGRRARLRRPAPGRPDRSRPTVCVVAPIPRTALIESELLLQLNATCAARGLLWEEAFDVKLDVPHPERRLRALVSGRRNVCWILLACTAPIQHWFARAGVPTLILGSCVPGVALPSIDFDYRAIGWHAAGSIIQHGHRQIVLVHPQRLLGGDLATCQGFLDYLAKCAVPISVARLVIRADPANLRPRLDQLLRSRPAPSAIFCLRPDDALRTLVHLLRRGVRVPEEVSLLSRDSHPLIESALPEISRYHGSTLQHSDRAVRLAATLLTGHKIPPKPKLFIPTFIAGSTLAVRRETDLGRRPRRAAASDGITRGVC